MNTLNCLSVNVFKAMKYLSIKEASELFKKSVSTIRRTVMEIRENKDFQVFMNYSTLKDEQLKTGHLKIYILEEFLKNKYEEPSIQPELFNEQLVNNSNEQLDEQLKNRYINTLEKELDIKNDQIKQINEAFKNQQDIIYQLQEQIREIKMIEKPTINVEPVVSIKPETFEEAQEVNPINDEEAVLSDDPEQLPGQTMMPFKEEQLEKDQVEKLSKHRRDILSEKLARGEKEAEERRKRVQELRGEK